ncbi:MAG: hypothetical protein KGN36_14650, partial [Acidobacteriota bacterium]|nr:hypothetical protein [Acidobacteriota bacterium]
MTSRSYAFPSSRENLRRLTAEQFADSVSEITGEWRVSQSGEKARYAREWELKSTPMTRAMGRPIRDQVFTTREDAATTLQALELVNGETLTHWLLRGARKMLGELPPEPVAAFDRSYNGRGERPQFDIDVSRATRVWLLARDSGTYSPEKIEAIWAGAAFTSPAGGVPLSSLQPIDPAALRDAAPAPPGVRVKFPSVLAYDIAGRGFTHLRGQAGIENREITSELNPRLRFFIFLQQPNLERLTPVAPETPVAPGPQIRSSSQAVDRVFLYALGRAPSPAERAACLAALGPARPSPEALADLLWAVMMKPEFQLID